MHSVEELDEDSAFYFKVAKGSVSPNHNYWRHIVAFPPSKKLIAVLALARLAPKLMTAIFFAWAWYSCEVFEKSVLNYFGTT